MVPIGWTMRDMVPTRVGIKISEQDGGGRQVYMKALVNSSTYVALDAFESIQMRLSGIMRIEENILNQEGYV